MGELVENITSGGDSYHNKYSKDSPHNKGKFRKLPQRCAVCGKGPKDGVTLDIHHKSGNRKNKNRSDLIVLCRKHHRQLHDSGKFKKSKATTQGSMLHIYTPGTIINEPTHPEMLQQAMAKDFKNADLMYTSFILVHAGRNGNRDEFFENELETSFDTPKNKPINWEHSNLNIGVVYDSFYVKASELSEAHKKQYGLASNARDFIQCEGAIWKYKFPKEAKELQNRYQKNELLYSMEVWFQKAICSICGEEFYREMDYCDHLIKRYSNRYPQISRKLYGYNFGGAAVTKNPADRSAVGLSLASKIYCEENMLLLGKIMNIFGYTIDDYIESLLIKEVE